MFQLRENQQAAATKLKTILSNYRIGYLAGETRSGKTHTALAVGDIMDLNNVLFITKKKAISSIESDYTIANYSYGLTVINYESLHKIPDVKWDLIVCDEAHSMGAFPKPSKRTKVVKGIVNQNTIVLLMSGTPHPESYSQIYHQLNVSPYSPYASYSNFYKWAKDYVNIKQLHFGMHKSNDYSDANVKQIQSDLRNIVVTMTKQDAGFQSEVTEHVLTVEMKPITHQICKKLQSDKVVEGTSGVILADTGVKMMQKLHQLWSGTIKLEDGSSLIVDDTKARYIKQKFRGQKIAIFYKFVEELNMIQSVYGDDVTTDLTEFNETNKSIALQVVSGREGVNLSKASALIFLNIDFSATSYFQAKDRLTTKERLTNDVYWIFSRRGIERQIYETVKGKKNYTLSVFRNYDRAKDSEEDNRQNGVQRLLFSETHQD